MFIDRQDAGEQLAKALRRFKEDNPIIIALPRGGVPVAKAVADALHAPLDVLLVKKIGAPGQSELAIGAVAVGDDPMFFIDKDVAEMVGAGEDYIKAEIAKKLDYLAHQNKMFQAARPSLSIKGKTVILIDDGIATGSTVKAALKCLKAYGVKKLILGVPVAPPETIAKLQQEADEIICLYTPTPFNAISPYYQFFGQVADSEVVEMLVHSNQ